MFKDSIRKLHEKMIFKINLGFNWKKLKFGGRISIFMS
jgi:hypothetical protein